jgi:hypothetical protein
VSPLRRAWALYQGRRVVHINVNIVLAGVVSLALTSGVLALSRAWIEGAAWVAVGTAVVDGVFDVAVFALLHWLASRRGWRFDAGRGSIVRDTARLQLHRFVLAPVFYLVSLGGHAGLMSSGLDRVPAAWIAYLGALLLTRTIHTVYGLRTGLFAEG